MKRVYLLSLLALVCCTRSNIITPSEVDPVYQSIQRIDNGKYNAFGMTVVSKNIISLVFRAGTSHASDRGVVQIISSKDKGVTWSKPKTIYSDQYDDRNIAGGTTTTGRIIVFFAQYKFTTGDFAGFGYMYSDDAGATWSQFTRLNATGHTAFSPYGPLIQLPGGSLVQTWYGKKGNVYNSYLIKSKDNGESWSAPVTILSSTDQRYIETSLAYYKGKLIALARIDNGNFFAQAVSSDNGATWQNKGVINVDTTIGIKNPPFLTVCEGRLACLYAQRDVNKIRVMYYDGTSWGKRRDLTSLTAGGYPSVAYPFSDNRGVGWFYDQITPSNANIVIFQVKL
jgi:hypothetical protein